MVAGAAGVAVAAGAAIVAGVAAADTAAGARAVHLDFGRSMRRGDSYRRCSCRWVLLACRELLRRLLCCLNAVLRSAGANVAYLARVWGIGSSAGATRVVLSKVQV
jgi:hypothetical protein